jgi:hypothetical protein
MRYEIPCMYVIVLVCYNTMSMYDAACVWLGEGHGSYLRLVLVIKPASADLVASGSGSANGRLSPRLRCIEETGIAPCQVARADRTACGSEAGQLLVLGIDIVTCRRYGDLSWMAVDGLWSRVWVWGVATVVTSSRAG